MENFCKIIFFCLIFSLNAEAQMVTWQKWYDYNNLEDNGQDVIQTFDGGYIILSNSYTPGNPKSAVFKTDQFGKIEWQKLYDQNNIGGNFLTCYTISQVKDSGYVVSGGNRDSAIIFKINTFGDISWVKRYSKLGRFAGRFLDHKITQDGGIIASGRLYSPSIGYVVKTDSIGNIEWDSVYNNSSDIINIIESNDGSFYLLSLGTAIIKTNNIGNVIWNRNLILPNKVDLVEHSSGNIFVGGGADSMYLTKIDTMGTTIFEKRYYSGLKSKGCESMCLSRDGNILLAGTQNTTMVVSKIKPNGDLIFNKPIPAINSSEFAFLLLAVNSTNDSGFIITGFTNYPPNFLESNIYASKTDSACNAPLVVGISNNNVLIPESFNLYQNYPNPFNPITTIKFDLSKAGFVNLEIFDSNGKKICNLITHSKQAGKYEIIFNSFQYHLPSGIYFCKLSIDTKSSIVKLVLIK